MKWICLFIGIMLAMLLQAAGDDGQKVTLSSTVNRTASPDKNISINESQDHMSVIAQGSG
ncbi:MAG: hypothetical protein CG437_494, partial [Methanosaeta sp. NSP1]